jgi:hypothetical protein
VTAEGFREAWIGGTGVARNDPRVIMLYADLTGLPAIMVYYGALKTKYDPQNFFHMNQNIRPFA